MLRLRHRLALSMGLVALLSLGWLGGVLLVQARDQQLKEARQELNRRLQSLMSLLARQDVPPETLKRIALYDGNRIRLFDRQGNQVLDTGRPKLPDPTAEGGPDPPVGDEVQQALEGQSTLVLRRLPPERRLAMEPETIPVLVAAGPIPKGVVHLSRSLLEQDLQFLDLKLRLLEAGLIALLAAALLSYILTRLFADPLARLSRATERLSRGQFEPLPTSPDELGTLAASFNQMAAKLQDRDRLMQQFVADASHELRTPLASMKTLTEALENGALEEPEQARRFVQLIHSELRRLEGLVAQLTDLQRPSLERRRFDLAELTREVCEQMRPRLEVAIKLEPCELEGDPDRFRQVLLNLLENARRAVSARPDPQVKVTLEKRRLVVEDNGVGIPSHELERIFERFHRLDFDRSRDEGGSGLGLSICRALVQAHGGTIRAESGGGSTRLIIEL